ncbi:hypothetical protein [Dactylosporangium salmoneum]|uniref:Uncharacterized protein n=1 Tax=Dactylosporangium salmoneum TaxID=53361 RepID=A0ABN3G980_9ACTN
MNVDTIRAVITAGAARGETGRLDYAEPGTWVPLGGSGFEMRCDTPAMAEWAVAYGWPAPDLAAFAARLQVPGLWSGCRSNVEPVALLEGPPRPGHVVVEMVTAYVEDPDEPHRYNNIAVRRAFVVVDGPPPKVEAQPGFGPGFGASDSGASNLKAAEPCRHCGDLDSARFDLLAGGTAIGDPQLTRQMRWIPPGIHLPPCPAVRINHGRPEVCTQPGGHPGERHLTGAGVVFDEEFSPSNHKENIDV